MYDASIGKFTGVDPISDQFPHVSVYNYAENDPVQFIDLWGLQRAAPVLIPRSNLRVSYRNTNIPSGMLYNPAYNAYNPVATIPMYVRAPQNDLSSDLTSRATYINVFGAKNIDDPFLSYIQENLQAARDRENHGEDDIDWDDLFERAKNGQLMTELEYRLLEEGMGRRSHAGRNSSTLAQEVYEVYDTNSGEVLYIGLGAQGQNRPKVSLRNAKRHGLTRSKNLDVRVVERPKNREQGYQSESARIERFKEEQGRKPLLQGQLYSN